AESRSEYGPEIDAERKGPRLFGFQILVAAVKQHRVDLCRAAQGIAGAESIDERRGSIIGTDGRTQIAKAGRPERTTVASAKIQPVHRLPGDADLRIG